MYPIINLRNHKMDLHWYLRALEEVVIRVLHRTFSMKASRLEGFTGVWVGMLPNSSPNILNIKDGLEATRNLHKLCKQWIYSGLLKI